MTTTGTAMRDRVNRGPAAAAVFCGRNEDSSVSLLPALSDPPSGLSPSALIV